MRLLLAAATALVLLPATANATDWFRFYRDANTSWYMDVDTIQRNGQWTRVDQYAVYHQVSERTGVKSVAATIEIDCRRRVYRLARFTPYEADGTTRGSMDNPENGAEHENVPGSAIEAGMKFVCDNQRPGPRVSDPLRDAENR